MNEYDAAGELLLTVRLTPRQQQELNALRDEYAERVEPHRQYGRKLTEAYGRDLLQQMLMAVLALDTTDPHPERVRTGRMRFDPNEWCALLGGISPDALPARLFSVLGTSCRDCGVRFKAGDLVMGARCEPCGLLHGAEKNLAFLRAMVAQAEQDVAELRSGKRGAAQ